MYIKATEVRDMQMALIRAEDKVRQLAVECVVKDASTYATLKALQWKIREALGAAVELETL